ncbi:MAG: LTA synthase family protein, partial [Enterococcus hulanensis]
TLLNMIGYDSDDLMLLGHDLLSPNKEELVAFRNGNFVTKEYSYHKGDVYDNQTGELLNFSRPEVFEGAKEVKKQVDEQLAVSDQINHGDLLRFYYDSGLSPVKAEQINYKNSLKTLTNIEKKLGDDSTSVFSKNGQRSTEELYHTKTYKEYTEEVNKKE